MPIVYVGHPVSQYPGDCAEWVVACAQAPADLGGAEIKAFPYERNSSLNANEFCSRVRKAPGPVLLLQNVQTKTVELIREKLGTLVPILVVSVGAIEELRATLMRVCDLHAQGLPHAPLDVVVGLLMVRKLDQERMWGGNAKGFMWADNIPKGRGLDAKFEGRVPHVLNMLYQRGIIVLKTSQSQKKYALNQDRREEIYDILRARKFPADIQGVLSRCGELESVRSLDLLGCYDVD